MSEAKAWWVRWSPERRVPFEYHGPWWQSATGSYPDASDRPAFVAAVVAPSEEDTKEVISQAYDEPVSIEWSFVEPMPVEADQLFSARFPRAEWMRWPYPESAGS